MTGILSLSKFDRSAFESFSSFIMIASIDFCVLYSRSAIAFSKAAITSKAEVSKMSDILWVPF